MTAWQVDAAPAMCARLYLPANRLVHAQELDDTPDTLVRAFDADLRVVQPNIAAERAPSSSRTPAAGRAMVPAAAVLPRDGDHGCARTGKQGRIGAKQRTACYAFGRSAARS